MPSKGKAANVEKSAEEKLFKNFATLGVGNYGNAVAELFVTENISNSDYVGGMLRHNSSQGGIKNVDLSNKFYDTGLDLTYGSVNRNLSWTADLGYKNQIYNWYGVSQDLIAEIPAIKDINPKQTYNTFYAGGRLALGDSFMKESTMKYTRFWDAFASTENRLVIKPSMAFDIADKKIKTDFVLDYLSGSFNQNIYGGESYKYGFTNVGFQPSLKIQNDDLTLNVGAGFFYSAAQKSGESKFFFYPQITGAYNVVEDLMILYAGLEGGLKQNSYHDFAQENFFVSPTLIIAPTDQKYDIYAGLKGKLMSNVSYNISGSYKNEDNRALYKSNGFDYYNANKNGYAYGNSFAVVYDRLKTVSFFGELKADLSKNVSFGVDGTFSSFSTTNQKEAWNLPAVTLSSKLDVTITSKWYAGVNLFFVGERKDLLHFESLNPVPADEVITLKSYFDLNANVGYKYNDQLSFFLKGNNLANQNYQRWANYPVQGLQILAGANYKFDF